MLFKCPFLSILDMPRRTNHQSRRRTDFFALKSLTAQRSSEGSRAALAPGAVPKEMHRVYVFSVVGTSCCDVRAACSGATPSIASVARIFVPPATTRAGTAQRAIPTIALTTYQVVSPATVVEITERRRQISSSRR